MSRRAAKGTPLICRDGFLCLCSCGDTILLRTTRCPARRRLRHSRGTAPPRCDRYYKPIRAVWFQIVPNARIDDGLFDVCIVRPVSSLTVLRLLVTLFWGGHVGHPAVSMHQTRTLKIETDTPMLLLCRWRTDVRNTRNDWRSSNMG